MAMYLLLRSNKQSGPYSLEELITKGLKPYDLVWVEGKSAAWRYPSEVIELKPYAPVVEEQPYDRFYKRPQKESSQQPDKEKKPASVQSVPVSRVISIAPKNDNQTVFVSLPGNEKQNGRVTAIKSEPKKEVQPAPIKEPERKQHPAAPAQNPVEEIVAMETKYEQSLDEMKDIYRQTLLERRKKSAFKSSAKRILKKSAVFFYVLALGVLIGLTITQQKTNPDASIAGEKKQSGNTILPGNNSESNPIHALTGQPGKKQNDNEADPVVTGAEQKIDSEKNSGQVIPEKKPGLQNETGKESIADNNEQNNTITPGTIPKVKGEVEKKSSVPAKVTDIMGMVSVKTNEYKRGAFGGIKNLQLTVSNDTKYVLDIVKVELQYLKPSELPLTIETIEFASVAPQGTMTIKIPDNSRGIKVLCRVISVKSAQYENVVAGL